jgi:hypothetical protein
MMIVNERIPHHQVLGFRASAHALRGFHVRACNDQIAMPQVDPLQELLCDYTQTAPFFVNVEFSEAFVWDENTWAAVKPGEDQRTQAAEHPCAVCDDDVVIASMPCEPSREGNADTPATRSSLEVAAAFYESDMVILGGSAFTELSGQR